MFGFDWVANANDDWANYNLGAVRLVDHAMLDRPDIRAMEDGKDYPGYLYFLTVAHDTRPGSELMLAWLGALTRQSPFLIFMPLILGFEAVMLCAAAALALLGARTRPALVFRAIADRSGAVEPVRHSATAYRAVHRDCLHMWHDGAHLHALVGACGLATAGARDDPELRLFAVLP